MMPTNTATSPTPRVSAAISSSRRKRAWTRATAGSSGFSSASSRFGLAMAAMVGDQRERIELVVGEDAAGTRLDAFLAGAVPDLSRSRAKNLILEGQVTVGGATI